MLRSQLHKPIETSDIKSSLEDNKICSSDSQGQSINAHLPCINARLPWRFLMKLLEQATLYVFIVQKKCTVSE